MLKKTVKIIVWTVVAALACFLLWKYSVKPFMSGDVEQIGSPPCMGDVTLDILHPGTLNLLAMIPFHHIFGFVAVFLWYTYYGGAIVFPSSMPVPPTSAMSPTTRLHEGRLQKKD